MFNTLHKKANFVLEPVMACKVTKIAWSESRPLVLAVGSDNGSVFFYDFLQSKTQFCLEIPCQRNSVIDFAFHKRANNNFAIGYRNGEVLTYQLPDVFANAHPDEGRRLVLLLEDILYE